MGAWGRDLLFLWKSARSTSSTLVGPVPPPLMGVDPLTASAGAPTPELVPTPTKAAPEVLGKAAHATDSACVDSEGANSPEAAEDGVYTSLRDLGDDFFRCVRLSACLAARLCAGRWTVPCGFPSPDGACAQRPGRLLALWHPDEHVGAAGWPV